MIGKETLRTWLDSMQARLAEDARRAGLMDHASSTGLAREFVIREVLGQLLPQRVWIGTGRVIAAGALPSKQIDIVIFDAQYPAMKIPGGSYLFPIEGVIATMEVKSRLTQESLRTALENCRSVMRLASHCSFLLEDIQALTGDAVSPLEALTEEHKWRHLIPRTYVFAFDGLQNVSALHEALYACFREYAPERTGQRAMVPSVIASGGAIALAWGDPVCLRDAEARDASGTPLSDAVLASRAIYILLPLQLQFGIMASHLLWHIDQQLNARALHAGVRRSTSAYLSFEEYIDPVLKAHRPITVLGWESEPGAS